MLTVLGVCILSNFAQAQEKALGSLYQSSQTVSHGFRIEQGTTLRKALVKIEKRFDVVFLYRTDAVENKKVSSTEKLSNNIKKALQKLLEDQGLQFKYLNRKTYGIYPEDEKLPKQKIALAETVSGRVTDGSTGETLAGVNIKVKGTTTGTFTDGKGYYELTVPSLQDTLVFSFVGYQQQVVPIDGRTEIDVAMPSQAITGKELIVTAFQQKREQRSLGTSVGTVSGEEIAETNDLNVAKSLSGRVAGLRISSASSGPGGSSKAIIRGYSSLGGNNQPLYVVDGIPIDNGNRGSSGRWGGFDRGDGIGDINPQNIESISVLKGPNATALYGQRGANGVILITTKSGENREGVGVELSSSVTVGRPWVLPDFQNEYGQGTQGQFRYYNNGNGNIIPRTDWIAAGKPDNYIPQITTINNGIESPISWGPKLTGQQVYSYDGNRVSYAPQPNNVSDFYNTQTSYKNSLALSGGNDLTTFRFSYSNTMNNGMLPSNKFRNNNATLKGSHQFTERFNVNAKVSYVDRQVNQRPALADQQQNVAYETRMMPRNTRLSSLKQYRLTSEDVNNPNAFHGYTSSERVVGASRHWTNGTFTENPYWTVNKTRANDQRKRIIGSASLNYDLADWISLSTKAGIDTHTDQYFDSRAIGTRVQKDGDMSETVRRFEEVNLQATVSVERPITDDIEFSANVGGHYLRNFWRENGQSGNRFSVPDLITIGNTQVQTDSFNKYEYKTLSLLAYGQFSFRDYWYINWTARNDWSSTLPVDNDSFFYPSFSTNIVWTDAFNLTSDILSYGSVRASWAQAGSAADPYQLTGTYGLSNNTQAGQPLASFTNIIPLQNLKNELTTSIETGAEFRFFRGRLKAEGTYYHAVTENQILGVAVPASSGFSNKTVNAGKIKNYGVELSISGTPLQTSKWQWDINFNFASNTNEVVALVEGVSRYQLGRTRNAITFADPGKPYGEIYSPNGRWVRDENGNRMIDQSGLPIREDGLFAVGNAMPDWTGGISTNLHYMGISFSALIDISQGGDIFSQSNVVEAFHGTTKRTLRGRDGSYVAEGIAAKPDGKGGWVSTGEPNTIQVSAQDYWNRASPSNATTLTEPFLNDASYIALRSMSIGYSFPHLVNKLQALKSLRFSVVGNNLYYFERHTDGFSPESANFNVASSSLGLEYSSFPMARTISFNVNVSF